MISTLQRQEDGTIELTITIPWIDVEKAYETVMVNTVAHAELTGFRKGKAPRKLVEEKVDKTKIYEDALRTIIPDAYNHAITEQGIKPVMTPKVELKEAVEKKDWTLRVLTCEKPTVTLGDYKKAISDLVASKQKKIWVPGMEPKDEKDTENIKPTIDELLKCVFDTSRVSLPAILVEHEVNRLLSELIDQTKKLGLTVDQYLASTGRTGDSVHKEYEEQAKRTLVLEFALEIIADTEGIFVSDDDIDKVIATGKSDEEKKTLSGQRYYVASVLRRQKTLDFLSSLH